MLLYWRFGQSVNCVQTVTICVYCTSLAFQYISCRQSLCEGRVVRQAGADGAATMNSDHLRKQEKCAGCELLFKHVINVLLIKVNINHFLDGMRGFSSSSFGTLTFWPHGKRAHLDAALTFKITFILQYLSALELSVSFKR